MLRHADDDNDEPAGVTRSRPAPATSRDRVELVQRVLHAMSISERVTVRLRDGTGHVGQIKRRTDGGLVLDNTTAIALDDVAAITTAPPARPKPNRRDRRLARCAHAFGCRGHCLTKSRRYSIHFKDLRDARTQHVHAQLLATSTDSAQRELAELHAKDQIKTFEFVGVGHLTTADAYLAAQAAARARENRELAREALYTHHNRRSEVRSTAGSDTGRLTGPGEFEPFLTAREVAERLRVAPCTVLRYFDDGVLPGRRLRAGRFHPVRLRWSEIEAALDFEAPGP